MSDITSFSGIYRWLSNFYPIEVTLDGKKYASVEHAYQAAKTLDDTEREIFQDIRTTAAMAKSLGKHVTKRSDWDDVKLAVMATLLVEKFKRDTVLAQKLLDTGDRQLIEGNYWGDVFWGVCKGTGHNHLGILLMKIRESLR